MADRSASARLPGRLALAAAAFLACAAVWGVARAQAPAATPAPQAGTSQADAVARRAAERARALQAEAEALAGRETTLLGELRRLEIERDLRTEELSSIELDLQAARRDRDALAARRQALEARAQAARPALRARMVELYKLGQAGYLRLLFDVDDLRAAGRAYRTVAMITRQDRERAEAFRATMAELRATARTLEERQSRIEALAAEARAKREAAARAVAGRSALVAQIDARRDLNAQLLGELEAARQRLRALPAAELAAGAPVLPIRPFRGALDWPVEGRLAARFGAGGRSPAGALYAAGIVIASERGRPVRAVHEGVVSFAEPFTGFGNLVVIDHGNQAVSLYGHLATLLVERGARVAAAQALGSVGASPAGDAQLYFELRIDGKPVDPLQWLKRATPKQR